MTDTDGGSKFSLERLLESVEELIKLCVEARFVVEVLTRDKFAPRVEFPFYHLPEVQRRALKFVPRRELGFKGNMHVANLKCGSLRFRLADFIRIEEKFSLHVVELSFSSLFVLHPVVNSSIGGATSLSIIQFQFSISTFSRRLIRLCPTLFSRAC